MEEGQNDRILPHLMQGKANKSVHAGDKEPKQLYNSRKYKKHRLDDSKNESKDSLHEKKREVARVREQHLKDIQNIYGNKNVKRKNPVKALEIVKNHNP